MRYPKSELTDLKSEQRMNGVWFWSGWLRVKSWLTRFSGAGLISPRQEPISIGQRKVPSGR